MADPVPSAVLTARTAIGDALHDVGTAQIESGAVEAAVDTLESAAEYVERATVSWRTDGIRGGV